MVSGAEDYAQNVFINCPFDDKYKPLFDAAVFAILLAGFEPRCALEASNAGQARLYKIMDMIAGCRYGIHDISRTESSRGRLPRFNMPLELGLDLGCWRYGSGHLGDKRLLIMDRTPHRYQKFISDIAGHDVVSHSNSVGRSSATSAIGCRRNPGAFQLLEGITSSASIGISGASFLLSARP
jgi:hypothetical protein